MRKLILITLSVIVSVNCKAQVKNTDSVEFLKAMKVDEISCLKITIEGLKEVRHDALCRLKVSYAHELKLEIIKEKALLSKLQNN